MNSACDLVAFLNDLHRASQLLTKALHTVDHKCFRDGSVQERHTHTHGNSYIIGTTDSGFGIKFSLTPFPYFITEIKELIDCQFAADHSLTAAALSW